jgi:hypothetical protein
MLRFHYAYLVSFFFCFAQLSLCLLNGCEGYGNAVKGWRLKCEWWREVRLRQVRYMSPLWSSCPQRSDLLCEIYEGTLAGLRRCDAPRTARIGRELSNGVMRPRVKARRSVAGAP